MNDYSKLLKEHLKEAIKQGFLVTPTKSGHTKVQNPKTGRKVNVPSSPSRDATMMNAITRMGKIGYVKPKH